VPDLPELAGDLRDYFPAALRDRFAREIAAHPLRREIAATVVTNDLINRAGLTFIHDLAARTGCTAPEIVRAYRIVRQAFALPALWAAIEALDNRIAAAAQYGMLIDIAGVVEHGAAWLLRAGRLDIGREVGHFAPAIAHLDLVIADLLPAGERAHYDRRAAEFAAAGVPPPLAGRVAGLIFLTTAFEVGDLAERTARPIDLAARTFYGVGARFAIDEMRAAARQLPAETPWQRAAADTLIDDFYSLQAEFAAQALDGASDVAGVADPLAAWIDSRAARLAPAEALAAEMRAAANPDLAMLVVAGRQLRQALG
jgi:glutamate dehydrogenase